MSWVDDQPSGQPSARFPPTHQPGPVHGHGYGYGPGPGRPARFQGRQNLSNHAPTHARRSTQDTFSTASDVSSAPSTTVSSPSTRSTYSSNSTSGRSVTSVSSGGTVSKSNRSDRSDGSWRPTAGARVPWQGQGQGQGRRSEPQTGNRYGASRAEQFRADGWSRNDERNATSDGWGPNEGDGWGTPAPAVGSSGSGWGRGGGATQGQKALETEEDGGWGEISTALDELAPRAPARTAHKKEAALFTDEAEEGGLAASPFVHEANGTAGNEPPLPVNHPRAPSGADRRQAGDSWRSEMAQVRPQQVALPHHLSEIGTSPHGRAAPHMAQRSLPARMPDPKIRSPYPPTYPSSHNVSRAPQQSSDLVSPFPLNANSTSQYPSDGRQHGAPSWQSSYQHHSPAQDGRNRSNGARGGGQRQRRPRQPAIQHQPTIAPREDFSKSNKEIIRECRSAARELERAWGRGGNQGEKMVKLFDKKFEDLTTRIMDVHLEGKMDAETSDTVLEACAAILALEDVPHWDHVGDIQTIRGFLLPDGYWNDWPDEDGEDEEDELP